MPAAHRDDYASCSPGLIFQRLSQAPLLAGPADQPGCPPRRAPKRKPRHPPPTGAWLGQQLRAWPPTIRQHLLQALERVGYAAGVLAEDETRPLLELGQLPFYRLDLYRHWLLAQGGPDLLAVLRQHGSHLDESFADPTDPATPA